MVLYFTGTGNSRYVARKIAEEINDELISMNDLIKKESTDELISKNKPFIFVCPTYTWRIPNVVTEFIKKIKFSGSNKVYFILTCGGDSARAINHLEKLCNDKGFELKGMAEIKMPNNYVALSPVTDQKTAKKIIQEADQEISKITSGIINEISFRIVGSDGLSGKIKSSSMANILFYKLLANAKGFHFTDKCIGCGKCVELCPLNNITLKDKRPVWENNCTHCMACISGCPTQAIEYKNNTKNRDRYYLK